MRTLLTFFFGAFLLSAPAFAGEVIMSNGQTTWKSTQCTVPAVPPALSGVGAEADANDVNLRVSQYNDYVGMVQVYLNCLSAESQADATQASEAIVTAAQAQIVDAQQRANVLGMTIKNKKSVT